MPLHTRSTENIQYVAEPKVHLADAIQKEHQKGQAASLFPISFVVGVPQPLPGLCNKCHWLRLMPVTLRFI